MFDQLPTTQQALLLGGVFLVAYLLLIAAANVLRRSWKFGFGVTYHLFAVAVGLCAGLLVSKWESPLGAEVLRHVTAVAIVLAAFPAITIFNRLLWRKAPAAGQRSAAPQVLADVTGVVIAAAAVLATLQFVYDVKVPGLLAGSGVLAIVLGLAMQDLLGNLLAGLALHFEKSFESGDWLLIGDTHAKVIEISWRSTHLLTTDDVLIDVPNSDIVKLTITNFERPTPCHAVRATIGLHYDIPPARVQAVLREAAISVPGVCAHPEPVVRLKDFADSSIVYEIKVWIEDHGIMPRVLSDVRSHAWYAVRRAGMEIPYPQMVLHRPSQNDGAATARAIATTALSNHAIFGFLARPDIERLVRESPLRLFADHEMVLAQGAAGSSMFLLVNGTVDVRILRDGKSTTVATLVSGDCFGEMSLLTGEPRSATIIAKGEVEAVEIGKETFGTLIRENPDVVGRLGELLAQRQLANEKLANATEAAARIDFVRSGMLRRIRGFFQLAA